MLLPPPAPGREHAGGPPSPSGTPMRGSARRSSPPSPKTAHERACGDQEIIMHFWDRVMDQMSPTYLDEKSLGDPLGESLFLHAFGKKSPVLKILDFLMDNVGSDYSKTEIAEGTDLSRGTLFNVWPKLAALELVVQTREVGRARMYKLNKLRYGDCAERFAVISSISRRTTSIGKRVNFKWKCKSLNMIISHIWDTRVIIMPSAKVDTRAVIEDLIEKAKNVDLDRLEAEIEEEANRLARKRYKVLD